MAASEYSSQSSLFTLVEPIDLPNAEIVIHRSLFDGEEASRHFDGLLSETKWSQETIQMFGKVTNIPRLTAWYGDADKPYTYSGIQMQPLPWTERLLEIKTRVETISQTVFNSVLLNQYRDGNDSVDWHADDEPELGANPVIGSVSFGGIRDFRFRSKDADSSDTHTTETIELRHGDVLLMSGETQRNWNHQIPKRAKADPRINLTFRTINP